MEPATERAISTERDYIEYYREERDDSNNEKNVDYENDKQRY
jgi:hypothetical protein